MKLMIVDDDARIRKMIAGFVSVFSDEIFECGDGKEAQESYMKYLPDWVTMDLLMPEVDGITATRLIRSSFPDAKIIIVTTHDSELMRETAAEAGAFSYVLKENLSELSRIIAGSGSVASR
jgi:CheY-like chemotaxis protein